MMESWYRYCIIKTSFDKNLNGVISVSSCYRFLCEGTFLIIAKNCALSGVYSRQLYTPTQMVTEYNFTGIFKLSNANAQFNFRLQIL
jgi:hypothetical protein